MPHNDNEMSFPNPNYKYPTAVGKRIVFLKNVITRANIKVGDYTYFQDYEDGSNFENRNVLFHTPKSRDKLIIGKFCQIGNGVVFLMNSSLYRYKSFTSYPFEIIGGHLIKDTKFILPDKGNTEVGNDVLIGYEAVIMPGVKIGDGAIIGARSIVTKDVEAYSVVGGNPAELKRKRFDDKVIELLQKMSWWDWRIDHIIKIMPALASEDIEKLQEAYEMHENNML